MNALRGRAFTRDQRAQFHEFTVFIAEYIHQRGLKFGHNLIHRARHRRRESKRQIKSLPTVREFAQTSFVSLVHVRASQQTEQVRAGLVRLSLAQHRFGRDEEPVPIQRVAVSRVAPSRRRRRERDAVASQRRERARASSPGPEESIARRAFGQPRRGVDFTRLRVSTHRARRDRAFGGVRARRRAMWMSKPRHRARRERERERARGDAQRRRATPRARATSSARVGGHRRDRATASGATVANRCSRFVDFREGDSSGRRIYVHGL